MLTVTDISTTCAVVIFIVSNYVKSVDGLKLWLLTWLVNKVGLLLVVCHSSCNVIGYWLVMSLVRFDRSIITGYVYGVASQKRYISQVHRFGALCTELGAPSLER